VRVDETVHRVDHAAELYDLKIVFANIEDNASNQTRFFVIGNQPTGRTGGDKTSILFTTPHQAGALARVLDLFGRFGVNLTSIGSRPSRRRNWEYYFFVDVEGHVEDENVREALDQVRDMCKEMIILGSYPFAKNAM
jgi:chorismate mutase/prephenate dehydratase